MTRIDRIRSALEQAFAPEALAIDDESHQHAGHAGAATGRGHFRVEIVSSAFAGQSLLERHRRVYEALGDMMQTDIHALSLRARTPQELAAAQSDR
jgi:BolA family transcriptional regulator, general stress-responsive regulator